MRADLQQVTLAKIKKIFCNLDDFFHGYNTMKVV